jgi:nucleoside-diphosphate-sugar epimerase
MFVDFLGGCGATILQAVNGDRGDSVVFDNSKLKRRTGFQCHCEIDEGVESYNQICS